LKGEYCIGRGREENEEEVAEEDRLRTTRREEKILIYFQFSGIKRM
jgi:hypothetical protein